MSLTSTQTALLVATPILVGSVGRIPVGALTDRYGGRTMFTIISLVSIVPVLLVAFAGEIDSYALLLVFGFFLGIAGTAFAIGIPFVTPGTRPPAGFRDRRVRCGHGRHRAVGVLHAAVRAWFGYVATHVIIAAALALTALLVWSRMSDSPVWKPNTDPVIPN